MDHADITALVWLSAATIAHGRAFKQDAKHKPIFLAIGITLIANALAIGLHPVQNVWTIGVALLAPTACLYGIVGVCNAGVSTVPVIGLVTILGASIAAQIHQYIYTWAIFVGWCVIALSAWIVVLDPHERPKGLTRLSAFALAASLLADIPGVWAWAKTGRWHAECALSIVSAVVLATLPTLWRSLTSERSSQGF